MAEHNKEDDCWMYYKGKTLDVTSFLDKHPGGKELLEPYYGKDISEPFDEQGHSERALQLLDEFVIGSSPSAPRSKIDPYRGMVYQIWKGMSRADYIEMINTPQFTAENVRIFDSPYLEMFTKNPWYVIPIFWVPVTLYLLSCSMSVDFYDGMLAFVSGLFWWTLLEYLLHRFFFHCENQLPDYSPILLVHFLAHGIHHAFPMDALRLVFPPALSWVLYAPVHGGMYLVFPSHIAHGLMAGTVLGYIFYDMFHYFSHHANWSNEYFMYMKKYHMTHHYKNGEAGFGVSSVIWDVVFGTKLEIDLKPKNF